MSNLTDTINEVFCFLVGYSLISPSIWCVGVREDHLPLTLTNYIFLNIDIHIYIHIQQSCVSMLSGISMAGDSTEP